MLNFRGFRGSRPKHKNYALKLIHECARVRVMILNHTPWPYMWHEQLLVLIDFVSLPLFCQQSPNLPDPSGPLSKVVWSSSIEAANTKVSALLSHQELKKKTSRGPYARFSAEKKAEVGRRAAEHGVASINNKLGSNWNSLRSCGVVDYGKGRQ